MDPRALSSRMACFFVPMFPLAARLRSEPDLLHEAVAVVEGNGSNAHVVAATRRARKQGIRPGLSLAQARSILPKLIARGRDPECERTAQEALLDIAGGFSPRVEDAHEGVAYLDVTGMHVHFDAAVDSKTDPSHWQIQLGLAAMRAADCIGLPVRVGIAASKLAARVAAELPHSPTVVPVGEEGGFLAPLPLARLAPQIEAASLLHRWGIESIGQLAGLPESDVASRLGEIGRALHWAARGIDPTPLTPRQLPPEFREGMELEWPLVALEPFLFVANAALDRLARRLELQGLACRRLELTINLDPDGWHTRAVDLPAPTRDVKTMLTLLRLDLEQTPPGAPVVGFTLVAHPDQPRRAQLSLFGPAALSPDKVATTIARLASMVGPDHIGMAMTVDGHLPERFTIGDYAPPPPPDVKCGPRKSRGLLAIRVFRPPVRLEVVTREPDDDDPAGLQLMSVREVREATPEPLRGERPMEKKPVIEGPVRVSSGPWRLEEGWWRDIPATREYWDVELVSGGVYRVYHDTCDWFADGLYD